MRSSLAPSHRLWCSQVEGLRTHFFRRKIEANNLAFYGRNSDPQ